MNKFLIVLFFVSLTANAQSKGDFLKIYSETTNFINQINKSEIGALKDCACYELGKSGQRSSYCSMHSEPQFLREGINLYGESIQRKMSCRLALNKFVLSPISENYLLMKRAIALMEPSQILLNRSDATLSESFVTFEIGNPTPNSGSEYKVNFSPKHKIRQSFFDRSIPLKDPDSISNQEKNLLLKIYGDFGIKACLPLVAKIRSASQSIHEKYRGIIDDQICQSLIYSNQGWKTARDFPVYEDLKASRRIFREKFVQMYIDLITAHPILTLVSSSQPALSEIIAALDYMKDSSAERSRESTEKLRKGDLSQFVANSFAYDYAKLLWTTKGYDIKSFDVYYQSVLSELESSRRFRNYVETGTLITVAVGCTVPWGRGIGLALSLVKSVCMAGLGIPVNLYFAVSSHQSYSLALKNFFSSVEGDRAISNSFEAIDSADSDRLLSAVFLPVGMGLTDAKSASLILKQLLN